MEPIIRLGNLRKSWVKKMELVYLELAKKTESLLILKTRSHHHANPACCFLFPVKVFYLEQLPAGAILANKFLLTSFYLENIKRGLQVELA